MTTASTWLDVPTLKQLLLRIEETKPILTANVDQTEADRRATPRAMSDRRAAARTGQRDQRLLFVVAEIARLFAEHAHDADRLTGDHARGAGVMSEVRWTDDKRVRTPLVAA